VEPKPHVQRLVRLLHNRVVRRVLSTHPSAAMLLLIGDLAGGLVQLQPTALWDDAGAVLHTGSMPGPWRELVEDVRLDLALLARVWPVEVLAPYVLDLRQLDVLDPDRPLRSGRRAGTPPSSPPGSAGPDRR
jgi:hypothetical protein